MKSSKMVNTVLISGTTFLAGCYHEPVYTVADRDGVPVVATYQPHYHYSPFYGGYVPIIVPIGGFSNGITYHSYYNSLPASQRASYAAPTTSRDRRNASPTTSSSGTTAAAASATSGRSGQATPTQSKSTSSPTSSTVRPSSTTSSSPTPTSSTVRGIAGGLGGSSAAS